MPVARQSIPDRFLHERELRRRGLTRVAGVDEAGRGPLAGPVVAAAVCFPAGWIAHGLPAELAGLNDSKQLSAARRERYFELLHRFAETRFAIEIVAPAEIDRINILNATHAAMNGALAALLPAPEHVLVDGLAVASLRLPQTALVKGDSLSYSIAAASILAKVTRDRLMLAYDAVYPEYGFAVHKGYGTAAHLTAIERHGPCPLHRRSFAPLKGMPLTLFPA